MVVFGFSFRQLELFLSKLSFRPIGDIGSLKAQGAAVGFNFVAELPASVLYSFLISGTLVAGIGFMGWIHYLAFDLMVGWFIVNDAQKHEINRFLTIPCLLLSFMLGPTGLLLYLILRLMLRKQYFLDQAQKN